MLCTNGVSRYREDAFYEHAVQKRFLKSDIVIVMSDLNAKMGFDNTLPGRMKGKYGLGEGLWMSTASIASLFVAHCSSTKLAMRSIRFQMTDIA